MIRILVLSDFHGATHVIEPLKEKIRDTNPDIVTFSGDIVKGYKRGDEWLRARDDDRPPEMTEDIQNEEREDLQFYKTFFSFLSFLESISISSFVVPGNMDAPESRFMQACPQERSVHHVLQKEPVCITGFGGQLTEDKEESIFVLQYSRHSIMKAVKEFAGIPIDILITHSPPVSSLSFEDGQEKGSLVVNDIIELLNPKYLFCGHAHKSLGSEWIKTTLTVNPGALKYGNYCLVEGDTVEFGKVV